MDRITRKDLDHDYNNPPCHNKPSNDSGNEYKFWCGKHSLIEKKNRGFDQRYACCIYYGAGKNGLFANFNPTTSRHRRLEGFMNIP